MSTLVKLMEFNPHGSLSALIQYELENVGDCCDLPMQLAL